MRFRTIFDETPYDIVTVHQVGQKSSPDNELVDERLVTILKSGCLHTDGCLCLVSLLSTLAKCVLLRTSR